MRIGVVATKILHMAEHVSLLVLGHGAAEIGAQSDVGDRGLLAVEPFDRKALHHHDAAPIQELAPHIREHVENLRPVTLEFLAEHIDEFVQHLNVDDAALGHKFARPRATGAGLLGVDEDVGVEERLHRSFASSRSNR